MRVPDFLVRQFYVPGSLQHEGDGFRIEARNAMADGTIVGVGSLSVDRRPIDPAAVTAARAGDEVVHRVADVSPATPVRFRKGDVVTFHVAGQRLSPGRHRFEVEIFELNMGSLVLSLFDEIGALPG